MQRALLAAVVIAFSFSPVALAVTTDATSTDKPPAVHKKRPVTRHWHGYGFLPGYRPPEVIARERAAHYYGSGPHYYGPAWPGFYRGRWNGGGFGPCYTQTPIGPVWNCGM